VNPELQASADRVVLQALLNRFVLEQTALSGNPSSPTTTHGVDVGRGHMTLCGDLKPPP